MTNKDLIKQYVDTGLSIPEYQFSKLGTNDLKTYLRKRIIAHNTVPDDAGYSRRLLSYDELNLLKPHVKSLPKINTKPYENSIFYLSYYGDIFPELFDNISDELKKELSNASSHEITKILNIRPDFITFFKDKLDKLFVYDIIDLLKTNPSFYPYLKNAVKKMHSWDLNSLIKSQPKLVLPLFKDGLLSGYKLDDALDANPELYNSLPPEYFDNMGEYNIITLLEKHPNLANNKNIINKVHDMSDYYQKAILKYVPQLISKLPEVKFDYDELGDILESNPELSPKVKTELINRLSNFYYMTEKNPEFYLKLTPENKLKVSTNMIINSISNNPNNIKYFKEKIPEFDFYDIQEIVHYQPKLLEPMLKLNNNLEDFEINDLRRSIKK